MVVTGRAARVYNQGTGPRGMNPVGRLLSESEQDRVLDSGESS